MVEEILAFGFETLLELTLLTRFRWVLVVLALASAAGLTWWLLVA